MTSQPYRISQGGRIDRSQPLSFSFDGKAYVGYEGDSLASALLANGVHLVARSFKYHRPRGIYGAGVEEPNALVALRESGRHEPNVRATTAELYDGLSARSQNNWPSLKLDLMAVNGLLSPVFGAGFYYKTFMGPTRKAWMFYEHFIRKAAGMGKPGREADPDRYEKGHLFCDILIVGAGPAGIAAALLAGSSGARVILVEQDRELGGSLLADAVGSAGDVWLAEQVAALTAMNNVRIMPRTCAFGAYDNLTFGLLERAADHLAVPDALQPRERFWTLRCRQAIIATGALERPIVFSRNDLPGIMLASAARTYVNRYGVLPGRNAVVFTNNDSGYAAAFDLADAGANVTIVDPRQDIGPDLYHGAAERGIDLRPGQAVIEANGGQHVKSVVVGAYDPASGQAGGATGAVACDLLCLAGGWNPTVHLVSQRGTRPAFDEALATFIADSAPAGYQVAGAVTGDLSSSGAVARGISAGQTAAKACGQEGRIEVQTLDPSLGEIWTQPLLPIWQVSPAKGKATKAFLDLQHDVSTSDVELAHREGYVSVEHLKRYTTLGMATDQGKLANVNALAIMAGLRAEAIPEVGTTTFRPPFTPVTIGALAGQETGRHFRPIRRTAMEEWHRANGAVFVEAGLWIRPWYYPQEGEDLNAAYRREAAEVRKRVGIVDVSTLGKIDVQGPDAGEFLNRVYVNGFAKLPVGRARYGAMLRPDGIVYDDGTTSRLSEDHYFMTTTTAAAAKVLSELEFLLQTQWQDLRVQVTSVTDQWAGMAVAGPKSRALLEDAVEDIDLSNEAFGPMSVGTGRVGDIPVRIFRLSFSGELAYEVFTPSGYGEELLDRLVRAGKPHGVLLYGLEAMGALRIEKGHVTHSEIDGRTTLDDIGLGRMASSKKPYIGKVLAQREGLVDPNRPKLVGLEVVEEADRIGGGALLFGAAAVKEGHGEGHVTSVTYSPHKSRYIGLGFLARGDQRQGEIIEAHDPVRGRVTKVKVVSSVFYDPEGERTNA
ncbi:sarcosine oxidase subunit alpha family protein [Limibacillus halophilus]|uniref:Sarcosine oxidase subunit alpha n=1 Tax=Limibacillus halophilus TaxID=1579333 RepID=A0A839STW0_9PROT|nr:sarcosine oxidase subunit alpha family protein [Limibacillus halophilus]MBB3065419.1 sarcosine oxidase subunit alpha [Limibacillus halophilus]